MYSAELLLSSNMRRFENFNGNINIYFDDLGLKIETKMVSRGCTPNQLNDLLPNLYASLFGSEKSDCIISLEGITTRDLHFNGTVKLLSDLRSKIICDELCIYPDAIISNSASIHAKSIWMQDFFHDNFGNEVVISNVYKITIYGYLCDPELLKKIFVDVIIIHLEHNGLGLKMIYKAVDCGFIIRTGTLFPLLFAKYDCKYLPEGEKATDGNYYITRDRKNICSILKLIDDDIEVISGESVTNKKNCGIVNGGFFSREAINNVLNLIDGRNSDSRTSNYNQCVIA